MTYRVHLSGELALPKIESGLRPSLQIDCTAGALLSLADGIAIKARDAGVLLQALSYSVRTAPEICVYQAYKRLVSLDGTCRASGRGREAFGVSRALDSWNAVLNGWNAAAFGASHFRDSWNALDDDWK